MSIAHMTVEIYSGLVKFGTAIKDFMIGALKMLYQVDSVLELGIAVSVRR